MITLTNKTIIVHQLIALCSSNTVFNNYHPTFSWETADL